MTTRCTNGFDEQYPRLYAKLKAIGHNPAKAIEILIDARRKNKHALQWCRMARIVGRLNP
jgi:hypothetical protein